MSHLSNSVHAAVLAERLSYTQAALLAASAENQRLRGALIQMLALVRQPDNWDPMLQEMIEEIAVGALGQETA